MNLLRTIGFIAALAAAAGAWAQLPAQKSSAGGVTVVVTPQGIMPQAKTWDFKVALDTHSQDLSDDFTKTTMLVDDRGVEYRPVAWEGDKPGGHHRSVVVKFRAADRMPQWVEMRMNRPGEAKPRAFRWQLN